MPFLDGLNAIKIDFVIQEINEVLGHLWRRIPDLLLLDTKEDFFPKTLNKIYSYANEHNKEVMDHLKAYLRCKETIYIKVMY